MCNSMTPRKRRSPLVWRNLSTREDGGLPDIRRHASRGMLLSGTLGFTTAALLVWALVRPAAVLVAFRGLHVPRDRDEVALHLAAMNLGQATPCPDVHRICVEEWLSDRFLHLEESEREQFHEIRDLHSG